MPGELLTTTISVRWAFWFDIQEGQRVDSIVEIGVYTGEMYRDTKAKVICSSYNAG